MRNRTLLVAAAFAIVLAVAPTGASAALLSGPAALTTTAPDVDLQQVHARRFWHCHFRRFGRVCHRFARPHFRRHFYGYHRPYCRPYHRRYYRRW
jgi:hypothetical protein